MSDDEIKVVKVDIPPSELRQALGAMNKDLQSLLEYQPIVAKLMRVKYLALVDEGFAKDEALTLCNL